MPQATHIFHNAVMHSFHEGFIPGQADALALQGHRIQAVGRMEELASLASPQTQLIDCRGKTLLPGFHDSHIHIWKVGNLLTFMLDVRGTTSLDEMLGLLAQYARDYPDAAWVTARGFNEAAWEERRMPTRQDLDRVIKDRPVYLIRTCAHIAVCNTMTLELCGIDASTINPPGGVIYKDDSGTPNGLIAETALGLVTPHMPPYGKEQLKTMFRAARSGLYKYGITAATDPAVDPLLLEAYYEMQQADELGIRLQAIPILLPDGDIHPYPVPEPYSSGFFTVNSVKFFSDGGLSGRTAALSRPYKGTSERGVLRLDRDQYVSLCQTAQERGLGIATHAIGDAAIDLVIDVYKELRIAFPSGNLRIEHLGLPAEKHLQDMASHRISTSMQTIFISELGRNFAMCIDQDYLRHCYPVRSALAHGILTALSSDAPVVKDFNPFKGMEAAITRLDNDGQPLSPNEAIGIREALQAYTLSAARISGIPDIGAIRPGNQADFILLDRDPLSTPTEQLTAIKVEATYIGGKCVWNASERT